MSRISMFGRVTVDVNTDTHCDLKCCLHTGSAARSRLSRRTETEHRPGTQQRVDLVDFVSRQRHKVHKVYFPSTTTRSPIRPKGTERPHRRLKSPESTIYPAWPA